MRDTQQPENTDHPSTMALYEPMELITAQSGEQLSAHRLLSAQNDVEAVRSWLAQYLDSPNTFQSYRKEAERLLLWAQTVAHKTLAELRHEDFLRFRYFLANPAPAAQWIMPDGARYPRQHPGWRPFAGPLSTASIQQALTILNNLLNWLHSAQYLPANPLVLLRRRLRPTNQQLPNQRFIPQSLWQEILHTIISLPRQTETERANYHRYRWVFSLLYGCGLRVSELCHHTMGDFMAKSAHPGNTTQWWLEILGKGNKQRLVPVTSQIMAELATYRRSHSLPPTPQRHERTPLVLPLRYRGHADEQTALTRASIHRIVRSLCERAAERLRQIAPERKEEAALLEQVSPHWLRHTAGTHMVENAIDLIEIRDNLGHQSLTTTNQYLHTTLTQRHEQTEAHHKMHWPQ